jgi:hypothetical protein
MRTLAMTAALVTALTGTGCIVSSTEPTGSVDLYWQFFRTTYTQAVVPPYDPWDNTPAGTGACVDSGVDEVRIDLPDGGQVTVGCLRSGTQGVALDGIFAGRRTFVVTGLRGGTPLYRSSVQVDVPAGPPTMATTAVADVYGLFGSLDLFFDFADASGALVPGATCANQAIDAFTFDVRDWFGTLVVSTSMFPGGEVVCSDAGSGPGVALDGIDFDRYTIRVRAWRNGTLAPIFDSCDTVFNTTAVWLHAAQDTGINGWPVRVLNASCP